MRILSLCFLCCLLTGWACDGNTRARKTARGQDFVSDPDHLYFLNVRSRDYRVVSLAEGLDAYLHEDLPGDPELTIRDNWLEDRAQLLLDDRPLPPDAVRELHQKLRTGAADTPFTDERTRKAATEVVEDYLRLVGG